MTLCGSTGRPGRHRRTTELTPPILTHGTDNALIRKLAAPRQRPAGGQYLIMTAAQKLKLVVNFVNLSTLAGFAAALIGRAELSRGPRGLFFATSYRLRFPAAGAFTLGNVVLTRRDRAYLDARPVLVKHEERHSWQYFCLIGLPMLPLYVVAVAWSWARTGCPASRNPFERLAGLKDGNYIEHPSQPFGQTLQQMFSRKR
jgi:hypothetical protein